MTPLEKKLNRKNFIKQASLTVCSTSILAACGNIITDGEYNRQLQNLNGIPTPALSGSGVSIAGNTITVDLTANDTSVLNTENSAFLVPAKSILIVNNAGTYQAYSSICPHAQCTIDRLDSDELVCPCHNSRFRLSGNVIQGPAAVNLVNKTINHDNVAKTLTVTA